MPIKKINSIRILFFFFFLHLLENPKPTKIFIDKHRLKILTYYSHK